MSKIIISPQFTEVLDLLENSTSHLFITGKAGTGKSTLLQHFRQQTALPLVVLAPTGVAAVNVSGETVHSFFHFSPQITVKEARLAGHFSKDVELYRKLELIIIDEISMVRSDLLDCVDEFLRVVRANNQAFGGVRMVFFGDLYQLPPVVARQEYETFKTLYRSEWFFDAMVMHEIMASEPPAFTIVELDTIYRQNDPDFIELLGAIRLRTIQDHHLKKLNERVKTTKAFAEDEAIPITLTGRRDTAAEINARQLENLKGLPKKYQGSHKGKFPDGHLPTEAELALKIGARVMFVANDPDGRFVNGTLGTIKSLKDESVMVKIDGGRITEIEPHTWELSSTVLSTESEQLEKQKVGSFKQLPLMLAWAVTIHKSQGKTFDNVVVNLARGAFAHGQVYVAMSRCRTFEGITLTHPVTANDIKMNWRVSQFLTNYMYQEAEKLQSREEKMQLIQDAIEISGSVTITYLKTIDDKTVQQIKPKSLGPMIYNGKQFIGMLAYHLESEKEVTYSAEKILRVAG